MTEFSQRARRTMPWTLWTAIGLVAALRTSGTLALKAASVFSTSY